MATSVYAAPVSTAEGTEGRLYARRAADTLRTVARGPQRPLDHLRALRHAHEAISRATFLMTDAARHEGATWTQIGDALGITRQAVRQAATRRRDLEEARADAKQWRLPLPVHRPRFRWRPRRVA